MKKVVIAGMLTLGMSLFAEVNLNDNKTVDNIALAGLNGKIEKVDKSVAGRWYLYQGEYSTWKKVRNDEFELDGAIEEAYSAFIKTIKENKSLIGETGTLRLGSKFSKYDFKKQQFPISLMSKNSYVSFSGDKLAGYSNAVSLSFDNVNPSHAILPMVKSEAKTFIKSRKHNGRVDRGLTARYSYVIKSIETPTKNINRCQENFRNCDYDLSDTKIVGHITKLEIIGKNEKILKTYTDFK
jgi:hypothetical protein